MQIEVFVSYAREDRTFAESIINNLEKEGLIVWWDKRDIPDNARNYRREIDQAIQSAQSVLVIWTEHSIDSDWVMDEAQRAMDCKKLVQFCVDVIPPVGFGSAQHVKADNCNYREIIDVVKKTIGIRGPMEHIIKPVMLGRSSSFSDPGFRYLVPGKDLFLSFFPCGDNDCRVDDSGVFLSMRVDATDGWITTVSWMNEDDKRDIEMKKKRKKNDDDIVEYMDEEKKYLKVSNDIYLIKDPIRPFTIQIGQIRSMRPNARPGSIDGKFTDGDLDLPLHKSWLSKTLAEIISDEATLGKLWETIYNEPRLNPGEKKEIQDTIARNPNAPADIQQKVCLFCNPKFREIRCLSNSDGELPHGAFIVANDFPFGPYFHYLAITSDPVHSWEKLSYMHMKAINLIVREFLKDGDGKNIRGAAGIGFGFNSTIRHLVLANHNHSSAGASIPHIHKQVWGMAPGTSNLADQLIEVSQAYENHGIDYQGAYMNALNKAGYVIWRDAYVMLYVPYGQSSKDELQVMVCKPHGCFTDLSEDEVISLSKAEYIALRLFKALEINSFNHVMLSKLFDDKRAPNFRLVEIFITREVDLAVSELSSLYVVDQHPWHSRNRIMAEWKKIETEVMNEIRS